MMEIAKGIKGVRKILADNNRGWHVMTAEGRMFFTEESLKTFRQDTYLQSSWIITDIIGNNIWIGPKWSNKK